MMYCYILWIAHYLCDIINRRPYDDVFVMMLRAPKTSTNDTTHFRKARPNRAAY